MWRRVNNEAVLIRLMLIIVVLVLALPLQMASMSRTLAHLAEHSESHESDDHHPGDDSTDHHTHTEHSHGDGSPVHSHAEDLAVVLMATALPRESYDFNISTTFREVSDSFILHIPSGRTSYLLLFRPPILA